MRQSARCNGLGEQEREVLRPAFDHLRSRPVHPGRKSFGGVAKADDSWSALDVVRQSDVFEHLFADGTMAANGEVSVAFHQDELAVGRGQAACPDR